MLRKTNIYEDSPTNKRINKLKKESYNTLFESQLGSKNKEREYLNIIENSQALDYAEKLFNNNIFTKKDIEKHISKLIKGIKLANEANELFIKLNGHPSSYISTLLTFGNKFITDLTAKLATLNLSEREASATRELNYKSSIEWQKHCSNIIPYYSKENDSDKLFIDKYIKNEIHTLESDYHNFIQNKQSIIAQIGKAETDLQEFTFLTGLYNLYYSFRFKEQAIYYAGQTFEFAKNCTHPVIKQLVFQGYQGDESTINQMKQEFKKANWDWPF